MPKLLMMLFGLCFTVHVHAFPCFVTFVKDSCWTNYDVTVIATNTSNSKLVMTVPILQGKSWNRQQYDCQPKDGLSFSSTFTPVIWENEAGKTYPSRRNWNFPEAIAKGDTAWNMTICYPRDFAGVPLPPDASGNCKCDTDVIPPVKPQ